MKVSNLQQFLRSLANPLQQLGAPSKIIGDVEQTVLDLEPFAELDVFQLAELLRQAKEYRDTGILPAPARRRSPRQPAQPKVDPAVVMDYTQRIRALEEKAATDESTRDEIQRGIDELQLDTLTKDNLVGIARELSRPVTNKTTREEAIDALRRLVLERKEVREGALT